MLLRGLRLRDEPDLSQWPHTVPSVAQIARVGLEFTRPVTFPVGENGLGKAMLTDLAAAFDAVVLLATVTRDRPVSF